ncbi:MAG: hypothetical protein GY854_24070 [Deltaproteobacteria bacterium]|nr:hypothetical protein [Deltaproteobacteria bacterium]
MKHVIIGIFAITLGALGLITWWPTFTVVMRGIIPFGLLVFGMIAVLSGYQRTLSPKKETLEDTPIEPGEEEQENQSEA